MARWREPDCEAVAPTMAAATRRASDAAAVSEDDEGALGGEPCESRATASKLTIVNGAEDRSSAERKPWRARAGERKD